MKNRWIYLKIIFLFQMCNVLELSIRQGKPIYTMSFGFHVYIGCYLVMPNFIEYFYLEDA
jgi:hypothetical protein